MSALGSLVVSLALDYAQYTQGLDKSDQAALKFAQNAQRSFDDASASVKDFLKGTVASAAGAVAGMVALNKSFNDSLEFSKSIRAISTQVQGGAEQVKELEAASKSLAVQFGTMPLEQSRALYEVLSAGIEDTAQATALLTEANVLATGGNADLQAVIGGLTSVMKGYGDKITDIKDVSDAFFVSSLAGKISIEELAAGLGKVIPLAEPLNVSFDELTASVAALTTIGGGVSESFTGMRAILSELTKPSVEAARLANKLGLEFNSTALKTKGLAAFLEDLKQKTGGSADALAVLFGGVEARLPVMALMGNAGREFNSIMDKMAVKAGAAQESFDKMAGPGDKFNQLMASINTISLRVGDTLANFLAPAAEKAAKWINELFGNVQVSNIDQQKQKIAELSEEIASLADTKHIPVVGDLLFDQREFDRLSQLRDDAMGDLFKMEEAVTSETAAIKKEAEALESVNKPLKANSAIKKEGISDAERFVQSLNKEVASLGKNASELKRMEAARLGILKTAAPLIDALEAEDQALRAAQESAQAYRNQLSRAASITESVMTEEEQLAQTQAELNTLHEQGFLSLDTYNKALKNAEEQFSKTGKSGKDALDDISQFAIQAQRNLQNALGDALFDGISGRFDSMVDGFANAIKRMITEAMAADILGSLFNKRTGNMAGLLSSFSMAGNASAGGGASGAGMMDMFGKGGMGSSSFAGSAAAALAGFAIGTGLGKLIGGDKKVGGMSSTTTSMIGAAIGGPLGGVIAGGINALFGRGPLKQKETNLIGDFTSEGFSGITSTKFKAQGGAIVGDKVDRVMTDTDTGQLLNQFGELVEGGISSVLDPFSDQAREYSLKLGQYLDDSIGGISKSLRGVADNLGIGTAAIDDFSMSINIASEKGKMLTDEQIAQVIADAGDAMASRLVPGIETLSKAGETALTTLQRVSSEFSLLTNLGSALGNSLSVSRSFLNNISFQDRTAFVDDAGGLDALSGKIQFFFDNFLTGAEQLQPSIELLDEEMGKLGLSTDMSKDQFKSLVQSFGHINGISPEMLQSLLNIAPLFARVKDAINTTADATFNLAEAEGLIADKRSALIAAYGREKSALESVVSRFRDLSVSLRSASDSLSLGSLSPLTPQQRLDEARTQLNRDRLLAFNNHDADALARLPSSVNAFLEASQTFNASSAEFVSDYNFAKGILDAAAALADTEADIAQKQLDQLESQVSKLTDINDNVISVETAINDLTAAVLQGFGNPNITDQQIRDFVNTPGRTTQEIIDAAVYNNVSAGQFSHATGTSLSGISAATGGRSTSDSAIRDFVNAHLNDPMAIYNAAIANGVSSQRLSDITGIPLDEINKFVRDNRLPAFERGTDFVQRGGLAVLHPAEAVTPASHMRDMAQEIKALRDELTELRREQNQQTGALINVSIESQRMNAEMIIRSNQDTAKSAAWRDQAKGSIR
jgi:TP901 family phage tail tape measure protein